jgi:hypothetical protein
MSYWHNEFSWWWAHGRPKYVENRNKHTWKRIVRQVCYWHMVSSWLFTRSNTSIYLSLWSTSGIEFLIHSSDKDFSYTEMHDQENIKFIKLVLCLHFCYIVILGYIHTYTHRPMTNIRAPFSLNSVNLLTPEFYI